MLRIMRKYGWKVVVLLVLAALVFVWLIRAPILSSYLTDKMGVPVSMRWIGIWPRHTNIHQFSIKNPPGYKGRAFAAEEIGLSYTLKELFGNPTVIDEIEVKHSVIRIDLTNPVGSDNNWSALGKVMPKQKKPSHVIIRKLILTDFNVEVYGTNVFVKTKQTHFDRLEFDNIDSQQGFPTDQLIRMIFQSSGIDQYIQNLFLGPNSPIQQVLPLRLFGP